MKNTLTLLFLSCLFSCTTTEQPQRAKTKEPSQKLTKPKKLQEVQYHPNGKLKITGKYDKDGNRHGVWVAWHENGNKWSEQGYKNGNREGMNIVWFENGNKRYEGYCENDKEIGVWKFWNEKGEFVKEVDHNKEKE